jgi:hypothetical protein
MVPQREMPERQPGGSGQEASMKFGFTVMADIDEIGFFSHAEALGYDSVWVADSQMLFSDCYAVLALAARQTSKLRIGPGTAICAHASRQCRYRRWRR